MRAKPCVLHCNMDCFAESSHDLYDVVAMIIFIVHKRKPRHREAKEPDKDTESEMTEPGLSDAHSLKFSCFPKVESHGIDDM